MNNVWTSFVCAARHFAEDDTTQCLKDKHIYIMGDSTSRQWFDYLIQAVPSKTHNYHTGLFTGEDLVLSLKMFTFQGLNCVNEY